ncbi:MAG: UDP-2,3-diacylglucosamine diphosphatase [Candidatus Dactylopiibacterium carminicum]|uniref:UDP-2,3-diacylglucosamine hydrolase n=1 Tax=Candidatus Dactylopiibacterium carminicum TaxID=857335 RepID=A0A272ERV4_9RHOO|nr:UDP-2,3-diacylglucosamine diphosphatase [Candidatus Dactylopiibacterium carminicum]KAF7598880.1 UDP-2,3-diacylglucosamine diphosphatase [Candidatus Dactylopiibacterium carminicum]PAS92822.1 MAG: UDP-2,3-diacylglucosamine diphosphatase [Candidatus Dactylopiibacterium carminicum]PAS96274.1 MAG: UDP-2,3-diacylglucosamine diphosphatase [Candidatus Dactylopiibacterium carminicum]PAS98898.1 MAG: UDP-2,3-diacylglucosamine diphosphatase [Candidatus Dactylopiibacterium carminicum]
MILFISDLHLCAERPETTAAFLRFLSGPAREADALWILGDLFESWVGDDELDDPFCASIADVLSALTGSGVKTSIIVGNRDFLLGKRFAARSGTHLVAEPALIEWNGHRIVLLHGDAQCTDDLAYQRFRRRIRSPLSLALLRLLPLSWRLRLANRIRQRSESATHDKPSDITDVNPQAIEQAFRRTGAEWMVHGHTHRPARHLLAVDGLEKQRWVLADWHAQATWLETSADGLQARTE